MTDEVTAEMPVGELAPETPETEPQAVVETPETESVETPDDAGEPEEKPKGGFQRRIKELADERNHWRELALRNTQQPPPQPKVEPPAPAVMPTLEQFGYDEGKYQAALIEYATKQAEQVVERRLTEAEQKRAEQARIESFAARQQEFVKRTPDFEDRVLRDPTLPITPAMRDVILDSPSGPEIAYYLATNRTQAEQIARLPAHLAALEMGRIEGRLTAVKEVKAKPVVTKAPPPAPTIETVDADTTTPRASDPASDSMDIEAWRRAREKQLHRRR